MRHGRQAGCQLLAALFADHPAAPAVGARSWPVLRWRHVTIIVAGVVLWLLPMILRGFAFGLLVVGAVFALHVVLLAAVALAQQQTRTTCYDSFRRASARPSTAWATSSRKAAATGAATKGAATPRPSTPRCVDGQRPGAERTDDMKPSIYSGCCAT